MTPPNNDPVDDLPPWLSASRLKLLANPAHALLLHGPSGLGHYELALNLAKTWLCEAPSRAATQPACGQCASCKQIHARSHTDLVVLMPETLMLALGWPLAEKAQRDIDEKKRKPSKEIRIDDIRAAVSFAELTSGRGQGKVILVYPAEAMNTPAANALLKTLEEPQASLRFVLATEASHQLLPTIRSRCQAFALTLPSQADALGWMSQLKPQAAPQALATALQASGGRPIDAIDLIASGADSVWSGVPKALQRGHFQPPSHWGPTQLLDAQYKLCHDLWAVKLGASPRYFAPDDLPKPPPARALALWSEQLKGLAHHIGHPWKSDLLVEDMVNQAKVCINSRL